MRSTRTLLPLLIAALTLGCDDLPTSTLTDEPSLEAGKVRLEVTGTSCTGTVRWEVGKEDNGSFGDNEPFPWTLLIDAESGDEVTLTACNRCTTQSPVTITTAIYWEGELLEAASNSGTPALLLCGPSSSAEARVP